MVLSKDELLNSLEREVRILLHLTSRVELAKLDYRPTPNQRSLLELVQYLAIMPLIHFRAATAGAFDLEEWRNTWRTQEAAARAMSLEDAKAAIAGQPAVFVSVLRSCSDADLRGELVMFGNKASRGSWIVNLVLCHYVAYRMQLFLYLKSCGRDELNTMNLWVGVDQPRPA